MSYEDRPLLAELANVAGVAIEYWDWQGQHRFVPTETTIAVLAALGLHAATEDEAASALHQHHLLGWRRTLPATVVARAGQAAEFTVHVSHGSPVTVDIVTESGDVLAAHQLEHNVEPTHVDEDPEQHPDGLIGLIGEARFAAPADLPVGYHTIRASGPSGDAEALLVVAPERLQLPDLPPQSWGPMCQLYAVRSQHSWGVGDFGDLATLTRWAAGEGADFCLINPIHAAEPVPPMEDSPYLPSSRRFLNPIYISVPLIPEYAELPAPMRAALTEDGEECNESELIERSATWEAKLQALEEVFAVPRSDDREAAFANYRAVEGPSLAEFATWCALTQASPPDPDADLSGPQASGIPALAHRLSNRIDFFAWLQWIADEQLRAAQQAALDAGMRLGLMTDLAVGVHPTGADAWSLGPALMRGISVGAPPDAFNQLGQNWSQPPWRPDQLADLGYTPYRQMLRSALQHAGALRIDHVMGLFRLWCVPDGSTADNGTYVRYDHEAMVSILLVEAARAGAIVIGEDLGVVEPFVRDYLDSRGILGTSILWFEYDDGQPRPPEQWRELCLATVTTHDLPPTAGYLLGDHVRLRESLHLLTRSVEDEMAAFTDERDRWLQILRDRGLLGPDASTQETVEALHQVLTAAPSRLLGVMLPDLVGDRRTQNQPGTYREYPNWRIPLTDADGAPVLLEDLADNERAKSLVARLRRTAH